jgi:DNA (cytosine-5)-methyltransferase 1
LNASFADKQGLEDQHALNGAPCFVIDVPIYCGSNPIPIDSASPTLTARMQGSAGWAPYNETAHLVPVLFENHPNDSRITGPHDVAPSCVSRYGTGGGNVPLVIPIQDSRVIEKNQNGIGVGNETSPAYTIDQTGAQAVAYSFDSLASNSMKSSNPVSGCNMVDVAKCIDTSNPCPSKNQGGIVVAVVGQVDWRTTNNDAGQVSQTLKTDLAHQSGPCLAVTAPTLTATNDPSRSPQSSEITQQVAAVHSATMQVRRLTPTECERLQGFPDGWTAIPWKKKLADDCPDGPRYKALGNSMAVKCMEWLGERIQKFDQSSLCQLP